MDAVEQIGPVQVVYKTNGRLQLDETNLNNILKDVQDKTLAVISIAGAFRTGKTFLLNFFLRYLQQAVQAVGGDWLGDESPPLTGFPWRNGKNRDTEGIKMWGKPFVIRDANGREIAVLLMDTQGIFDTNSTRQDNNEIFALSLLTSSVQIFNVRSRIGSDTLTSLQLFSDYARYFQLSGHSSAVFQKLIFLVRDWCNDYECAYGLDGGNEYLNSVLKVEDDVHDELRTLKTGLRACFSDLSCFLLPDPGKAVTCDQHFQGNLSVIDEDFVKHIKSFVPAAVAPDAIEVKKISIMPVQGRNFVKMFKTFVEAFQSNVRPKAKRLFEICMVMTVEQAHQNAVDFYKQEMDKAFASEGYLKPEQLVMLHIGKESEALKLFQSVTNVFDQSIISEKVEELSETFDEMLNTYITTNQERQPTAGLDRTASKVSERLYEVGIVISPAAVVGGGFQSKARPGLQRLLNICGVMKIEQAYLNASYYYKQEMDKAFASGGCLKPEQLVMLHIGNESEALKLFWDATSVFNLSIISESNEELSEEFDEVLNTYITTNQERQPTAGLDRTASKISERLRKDGIVISPAAIVGGGSQSKARPGLQRLLNICGVMKIEQAYQNSSDYYKEEMDKAFASGCYLKPEQLVMQHIGKETEALRRFRDGTSVFDQSIISMSDEELSETFDEMLKTYITKNQERQPTAGRNRAASKVSEILTKNGIVISPAAIVGGGSQSKARPGLQRLLNICGVIKIEQAYQNSSDYYKQEMDKEFGLGSYLKQEQLATLHGRKGREAMKLFRDATEAFDQNFISKIAEALSKDFDAMLKAYTKANQKRKPKPRIFHLAKEMFDAAAVIGGIVASIVSESLSKNGIVVGPAAIVGGGVAIAVAAVVAGPIGIAVAIAVGGAVVISGIAVTVVSALKRR